MNSAGSRAVALALAAASFLMTGCSSRFWQSSADREAIKLIREKTAAVANMDASFSIVPKPAIDFSALPETALPPGFLGAETNAESGARILNLERALETAVRQSREYQSRKELLFLEALDLSLARHRYTPLFSLRGRGNIESTTPEPIIGRDPITGETITALRNGTKLATSRTSFGFSWLLATGARLSSDFTVDFLRYLSGGRLVPQNTSSRLAGTLVQPLLQGAGFKVTVENLTQAEQNLLYSLREFAQYRQNFVVNVASDYFSVLRARDTARNSYLDLQRSKQNVARERAFAEEGQRPLASLDQLRQAELNSETRWTESLRFYRETLDRFKIDIGMPLSASIILDDKDLQNLAISDPGVPLEEAVAVALAVRLDLHTSRERVTDTARKIPVAKNNLLPQVDAAISGSISASDSTGLSFPDPKFYEWSAGLNLDLGLDRKSQRNEFRRTLIAFERARRQLSLELDTVRLQVSTDFRTLDQARRNFENAELGVTLAERRVEEQELRMRLGRGQTRDLLDAQADLNNALNGRTAALVNHTIARLRYWRDMGLLFVRDDGTWFEAPKPSNISSVLDTQP